MEYQSHPHIYVERRLPRDRVMHSFFPPTTVLGTKERARLFTTAVAKGFVVEPYTDYATVQRVEGSSHPHDRFRAHTQYSNAVEEFGENHPATLTHRARTQQ